MAVCAYSAGIDMTQDEIIEMAVQAGMAEEIAAFNIPIIEAFAKLVAAKAIAELESQEPVAYINVEKRILEWAKLTSWETPTVVNLPKIPLYTHPSQRTWVGLSDDEHCDIWYKESLDWMEYGKAIEAKLKEKNCVG